MSELSLKNGLARVPSFGEFQKDEELVDVTLVCEKQRLQAHKVVLSAYSEFFREIFKENPCDHPVIVFNNVKYADLKDIVTYIYTGECNVNDNQLDSFIPTVQLLEIKALYFDQLDEKRRSLRLQSSLSAENIRAGDPGESDNDNLSNNHYDGEEVATNPEMDDLENVNDDDPGESTNLNESSGQHSHQDSQSESNPEGEDIANDYPLNSHQSEDGEMDPKYEDNNEDIDTDPQDERNGAGDAVEMTSLYLDETIHNAQNETIYFNAEVGELSIVQSPSDDQVKSNTQQEDKSKHVILSDPEDKEIEHNGISVEKEIKLVDRAMSELEKKGFCQMDPKSAARKRQELLSSLCPKDEDETWQLRHALLRVTRLKGIWAAFEMESIVIPELEQLGNILRSVDKPTLSRALAKNRYKGVRSLANYFEMETRWVCKEEALNCLHLIFADDEIARKVLIQTSLPKEIASMLIDSGDDEDRIAVCAPLLGQLLSYGEPLSMDQFDVLDKSFVIYLLRIIEYLGSECNQGWISTVLIDIILFLNLQFGHDELYSNFVISAVSQVPNLDTFKQKLLFYTSTRLVENVNELSNKPVPKYGTVELKWLNDLFTCHKTRNFFVEAEIDFVFGCLLHAVENVVPGNRIPYICLKLIRKVILHLNYKHNGMLLLLKLLRRVLAEPKFTEKDRKVACKIVQDMVDNDVTVTF